MKLTNKFNLPLSVSVWLATDSYNFKPNNMSFSSTEVCKSVRSIVLSRRAKAANQELDISDLLMSRMGTAVHNEIERVWKDPKMLKQALTNLGYPEGYMDDILVNPTDHESDNPFAQAYYSEYRAKKQLPNGVWISGEFDFCSNGQLQDFKQCKEFVFTSGLNREKFRKQGSIYRWIHDDKVTSNTTEIIHLLKDWSPLRAMKDEKYLQSGIQVESLELIPVEVIVDTLVDKTNQVLEYIDSPEHKLPVCTPEELGQIEYEYKYYSNPANTTGRCTKNFKNDSVGAYAHVAAKGKGIVVVVAPKTTECTFCEGKDLCSQYVDMKSRGEAE